MSSSSLAGSRVLVTGATGAVGQSVMRALHAAAADVHALVRRPVALAPVTTHLGDITDRAAVAEALRGIDVVVHLAALLHVSRPSRVLDDDYRRVNDDATASLVAACEAAGVHRLVHASTIAVYGETGGVPVDENAPCQPDTPYGHTKLASERHVLAARTSDGAPMGVVLRLGAVYGVGVKGNYRRLLQALSRGRYVHVGDGRNRRVLVHEDDVAAAIVLALTHPAAAGQVYNVTDGEMHEVRDVIAAMCCALGRPVPPWRVPVALARGAASCVEAVARWLGRQPPVTRAVIDKLVEDVAVDGTRLRRELGFVPRFPLRDGWRDVVERMRQAGDLALTVDGPD